MSQHDSHIAALLTRQREWQAEQDSLLAATDDSRAAMDSYECERPILRGIGMVGTSGTNRSYPRQAPRARAHGAAAMPPNAEAAELLAAGHVEATVLCIDADGNETVRTVAEIRGSRKNRARVSNGPAQEIDTARFGTGHDFTA